MGRDFIEDMLGVVMPRSRGRKQEYEPQQDYPQEQPPIQPDYSQQQIQPHPSNRGYDLGNYAQPQNHTMSSAPTPRMQRHVENYPSGSLSHAPQYENVEVLAAKMLNQFDMKSIKRDYEEHMYELNDKITGRGQKSMPVQISGSHIPKETEIELARLEDEDRKIEGTMESRLWYLADAYSVHTPDGRMKLFDLIESLFKFIKVNNVYGIIEYVKVIIPKTLELVTVHVKLFEDYEQRDQNNRARLQLLNGLVEDYFGHIARLEEENDTLKHELYWEYRYKGLRAYYEKKFGNLGMTGKELAHYLDEVEAGPEGEEAEYAAGTQEGPGPAPLDPRVRRMLDAKEAKRNAARESVRRSGVRTPPPSPPNPHHKRMTQADMETEEFVPQGEK